VINPTQRHPPDNSQHYQRQISKPLVEFEPAVPLREMSKPHALERGQLGPAMVFVKEQIYWFPLITHFLAIPV